MKHTPAPWTSTFTLKNERGVRAEGGFICFLPKPSHYSNQDQRYEDELEESMYNAKLIAAAPELLMACIYAEMITGFNTEINNRLKKAIKKATKTE